MSAQINSGGCQKGGYICDCGFRESRVEEWQRHVKNCDIWESSLVRQTAARSSGGSLSTMTLGRSSREKRQDGGDGVLDTMLLPDDMPEGQAQGKTSRAAKI